MAKATTLQRSQTKSKINAVSKASLAMLNPAHAMGIETNWHDDDYEEAEEPHWRKGSSMDTVREAQFTGTTYDNYTSHISPTPELAAFAIDVHSDSLFAAQNDRLFKDAWNARYDGDGLDNSIGASSSLDMQRTPSGNGSFFEDDEVMEHGRTSAGKTHSRQKTDVERSVKASASSSSSALSNSSSLSRFFTFKRSNNTGKPSASRSAPIISSPCWDVPASAPPHITTFENIEYPTPPKASLDAARADCNSVPTTPLDNYVNLPSISSPPSRSSLAARLRSMSRKSSMPSLREVRRMTATPSVAALQQACTARGAMASMQSALANEPALLVNSLHRSSGKTGQQPPKPSGAPAHARIVRPANRISSVGKGARKSAYDSMMSSSSSNQSIVLSPSSESASDVAGLATATQQPAPQSRRTARKKNKRFEASDAPIVPPLPPLGRLLESASTETVALTPSSSVDRMQRRRSRSVDAIMQQSEILHPHNFLPSLVTPDGLFDTSIELGDGDRTAEPSMDADAHVVSVSTQQQAQRVNLSNRPTIIGISSPKLVNLSPRIGHGEASPRSLISPTQRFPATLAAPVVVNVMPPTPDLSADGHETFDGHKASPSVRKSLELSEAYFSYNRVALEAAAAQKDNGIGADEKESAAHQICGLPGIDAGKQGEKVHGHHRTQSTMSDLSDFSSSAASEASRSSLSDDPFGFARSLSMMSMDSNLSSALGCSEHGGDSGSDSGDEESSLAHAQIVCVSPSASYSKAQLVSPSAAALMSPRGLGSSVRGSPSLLFSPLASSSSSSLSSSSGSLRSPASRSRKRDSGSRFAALPSALSSVQTLASVMTTATSLHGSETGSPLNEKRRSASLTDLRAPAEIQVMINSLGADEDDCDTPRLSHGFFRAPGGMPATFQPTRPLNVRKGSAPSGLVGTVAAKSVTSSTSPTHISPERRTQALTASTPGLSPAPMRPFPRAQNSSSPHLELDLSLPLDLHDIGLGFEVEEDKPRRRNQGSSKSSRPKLPSKARSRSNASSHDLQRSRSADVAAQHTQQPKTPPTSSRLMASAMARDAAMGLGLDLGLEGFSQEPEQIRKLGSPPSFQPMRRSSSDTSSAASIVNVLQLTEEEQSMLGKAALRSVQRVKAAPTMMRSGHALRTASSLEANRPGSAGSVASTTSVCTVRPGDDEEDGGVYEDMTGVAM